jgi:hypothetical protein
MHIGNLKVKVEAPGEAGRIASPPAGKEACRQGHGRRTGAEIDGELRISLQPGAPGERMLGCCHANIRSIVNDLKGARR